MIRVQKQHPMFCRHRERTRIENLLCFCRCLWPERNSKSVIDVVCDDIGRISFKDFLEDDGAFVGFFDRGFSKAL